MGFVFMLLSLTSNPSHGAGLCDSIVDSVLLALSNFSKNFSQSPTDRFIKRARSTLPLTPDQIKILKTKRLAENVRFTPGSIGAIEPRLINLIDSYKSLALLKINKSSPSGPQADFDFIRKMNQEIVEIIAEYLPEEQRFLKRDFSNLFVQYDRTNRMRQEALALAETGPTRRKIRQELAQDIFGLVTELKAAIEIPNVRGLSFRFRKNPNTKGLTKEKQALLTLGNEAWLSASKLSQEDFLQLLRLKSPDLAELLELSTIDFKKTLQRLKDSVNNREYDVLAIIGNVPTLIEVKYRAKPIQVKDLRKPLDPEDQDVVQMGQQIRYQLDTRNLFAALLNKKPEDTFAIGVFFENGVEPDAAAWLESSGIHVIKSASDKSLTISD